VNIDVTFPCAFAVIAERLGFLPLSFQFRCTVYFVTVDVTACELPCGAPSSRRCYCDCSPLVLLPVPVSDDRRKVKSEELKAQSGVTLSGGG
jgi:hypothetical protein